MTKTASLNAINEYVCYFMFTRMLCCNNNTVFSLFVIKKMNKGRFVENYPYLSCSKANSAPLAVVYLCCVDLDSIA